MLELNEKEIVLDALLKEDRYEADRTMLRRNTILKLQREIAEAKGQSIPMTSDDIVNQPTAKQLRDEKERVRNLIVEILNRNEKPMKFADLQDEVNEKLGKPFPIREVARSLQRSGRIGIMKFGNSNRLAYWIKPEWIDKDSNTLHSKYHFEAMIHFADKPITFE